MTEPRRPFRGFPPPAKPIRVPGGLTARSKRGEIAQTWWSRRFIEVLESFGMGGRLQSGKRYARAGQVLSLTVSTSLVTGLVQGSRPEPYKVRIAVKAFGAQDWKRIERALAGQALYAAKLLAGEFPTEVEEVFTKLGLRLFPDSMRELTMDCSCPDWEVPCKHLAAACYLLAESFDEDPFQILAWRGRSRADLLERLRELRSRRPAAPEEPDEPEPAEPEPDAESFWTAPPPPATRAPQPPAEPDALLDQLAPLPLSLGGQRLIDLLRPAYESFRGDQDG
ncbi:MAG TPA: SWIM zinc finger family protein [Pseudonocardiaceae bacterium]|nr:SWIM zinc finger family protein [Pseudonocardiaceae bacterium]